jgi:hypothetical protein
MAETLIKDAPRSPPKKTGEAFSRTRHESPLATLRDNIIKDDREYSSKLFASDVADDKSVRFRTASGNLIKLADLQEAEKLQKPTQQPNSAANVDGRLDRIASCKSSAAAIQS